MNQRARLLVLQHLDVEHPGIFREFLRDDGIEYDAIELDLGEAIPPVENYAGLWVMGGPMDVWETKEHPWLIAEMAVIREAISRGLPFLGICLGHQLLAAALGAEVAKGESEVGVMPVSLTQAGRDSAYFHNLDATLKCLQWHSAEVKRLPAGAVSLAASDRCAIQAMTVGDHALSAQFHVEVTHETVPDWGAIPAYAAALEQSLGANATESLAKDVERNLNEFNVAARTFYENWKHTSGFSRQLKAIA